MKLVRLDKDYSIKLKSKVTDYLNPDYIYIPVQNHPIPFKKDEKVKKGTLLFDTIYSPISGKIIGLKECTTENGNIEKCLVIANDFQETLNVRTATRKKINQLTKEELISSLRDIPVEKISNTKKVKCIIISGIDDEPYIANEIFIQKENTKLILEMLDALLNIFGDCKAIIAIKNIDGENIEAYNNYIGTYKNIELHLVEDLYLIGEERNLIEKLRVKEDYLFLKASEIYKMYHNVKKCKPVFEKYVTISGDALDSPQVFNVKLGAKIADIFSIFYNIDLNQYDVYVNGLMRGKKMDIANLIVTKEMDGILVMKKEEKTAKNCINCGKCIEICPINSNPLRAYKKQEKVPCIHCGLCSYICPAYINLKNYLNGDKNE